jgi:hypothetical protein
VGHDYCSCGRRVSHVVSTIEVPVQT